MAARTGAGTSLRESVLTPPTARYRRLIVNADDFGRTSGINQAVIRAHREGILTTASLMVNEVACEEAVELALQHPRLGVGLHLSLLDGRAALPPRVIPGLVDARGQFRQHPMAVGLRYFAQRSLRSQLQAEIAAQFGKFRATGLPLDHVNGHLHLHLHPTVFSLLIEGARQWGITRLRLTRDPFWLNARLARGRWLYRLSYALIYRWLADRARPVLQRQGIRHSDAVFGLLQNAAVDERYLLRLLPALPPGNSELYSHPSIDEFRHEFNALVSPRVKALVAGHDIQLIRYQDL